MINNPYIDITFLNHIFNHHKQFSNLIYQDLL